MGRASQIHRHGTSRAELYLLPMKKLLPLALLPLALAAQHVPGRFYAAPPDRPALAKPLPPGTQLPLPAGLLWEIGPLSDAERLPRPRFGARQIGLRRPVPAAALASATATALPDGRRVVRVALGSEGAEGLRVHFEDFSAGTGQVWVYAGPSSGAPKPAAAGPYTGRGPLGTGDFWSSTVASSSVIVEFDAPAGASSQGLPFRISAVSHQWSQVLPRMGTRDTAASCELDISCYPSYLQYAGGVSLYDFVAYTGGAYVCTGAMVNTTGQIPEPYMLTANHCISNAAEAQSAEFYFDYQTSSCNGPPPNFGLLGPEAVGATYLAGAAVSEGDYTLLQLSSPPTSYYFGWSATDPPIGSQVVGIHHPEASWTRISFGTRAPDQTVDVSGTLAPANLYDTVDFTQGIVEPGSSGSPLLNADGDIVGTLTAAPAPGPGQSVCDIQPFYATYGRFSTAYAVLQGYLNVNPAPAFTVAPQGLQFTQSNGVPGPDQQITITTQSLSPVAYTMVTADGWLLPGPNGTTGQVSAASPVVLGLQVYNAPLTFSGTYKSSVTVTVGTGAPVTIPVTVTVANTQSNVLASLDSGAQFLDILSVPDHSGGADWIFNMNLTEVAGVGTQLTAFKVGGVDYSSMIPALFGGSTILPAQSVNAVARLSTNDGIPTFPSLTQVEFDGVDAATGVAWSRVITGVTFEGTLPTDLLEISIPQVVRRNASSPDCPFRQHFVLQAVGVSPVTLAFTQGLVLGNSPYTPVAGLVGSTYIPAGGTLQSDYCWPDNGGGSVNGGSGVVQGTDPTLTILDAYFTAFLYPADSAVTNLAATPSILNLTAANTEPVEVSVDPGSPSAPWDASVFYAQPPNSWLSVTPLAGAGPGTVKIAINPAGLASGVYLANLIVESQNAIPQYLNIPVTLTVPATEIAAVNGASFTWGAAPGMIVSLFSSAIPLATGTGLAESVPLPTSLQGTTVTVNGRAAPLYYVSPTQVNAQIPYEVPPGTATLTVRNSDGQAASQQIYVNAVSPGVFLSGDGKHIAPSVSVKAGDYATLYLTGQGFVSPTVATGAAPPPPSQIPVTQLPQPLANVAVLVNGVAAQITFAGIPYYLAGVTQVNFIVPPGTPAGDQPVTVTLAGVPSNTVYLNIGY
jgi:uncharacterized protein (TIGR03437 family)